MPNDTEHTCSYCPVIATYHGEGEYVCAKHIYPAAHDEYHSLQIEDE